MEHLVGMFGPDEEEEESKIKVEDTSKLPAALPPEVKWRYFWLKLFTAMAQEKKWILDLI